MHSPPIEWSVWIGSLALIDYIRAQGEADKDTLSEVVRDVVARHPLGSHALALALVVGSYGFHRHITRPLHLKPTAQGEL